MKDSKINKLIQKELKKVVVANISNYNEDKNQIIIPRFNQVLMKENEYYLIKLDDELLNPNSSSTLATNWNQGRVPTSKYMKIDVMRVMGKMVNINGLGYDYINKQDKNEVWSGWLPITQITVIEKI